MGSNKIQQLISKYWEGETSLEEEKWLRENAHEIEDQELRAFFEQMHGFSELRMRPPADLPKENKKPLYFRLSTWTPYAIAASMALLIWWNIPSWVDTSDSIVYEETFEDPELAMQQTEEALAFVVGRMKSGTKKTKKSLKKVETLSLVIPN